jgi:autotransporter-associated beta strand protein
MKTKLPIILSFILIVQAYAGSATWNLNPSSDSWNTAGNWTPATVPNAFSDIATFEVSNQTSVTINKRVSVDSIVFNEGASAYTITDNASGFTAIEGAGILNNSGVEQHFVFSNVSDIDMTNNATITGPVSITLLGDPMLFGDGSANLLFEDSSSAGEANITAGPTNSTYLTSITFYDHSSAENAVLTAQGGTSDDSLYGGYIDFQKSSTADNAIITANGATVSGSGGGSIGFEIGQTATATLIVNGGSNGGAGGQLWISQPSADGAQPRVEIFGNGTFHAYSTITIGSLEGDGQVYLRLYHLTIGANGLSTIFSGTIQDGDMAGGSISKIGSGTLTLAGANLYTGGTTVSEGTLTVTNQSGSATGTGAVSVTGGTLGGSGIISGGVIVGTGTGPGANLAPALGAKGQQATLTLQSSLTVQADATYTYTFKARSSEARSDLVITKGVTINGATIKLKGKTQGTLTPGTVLTAISNTSADPISGTFNNLPDGAIITVNGNNLQASYEGGDGNDLTLTVVP